MCSGLAPIPLQSRSSTSGRVREKRKPGQAFADAASGIPRRRVASATARGGILRSSDPDQRRTTGRDLVIGAVGARLGEERGAELSGDGRLPLRSRRARVCRALAATASGAPWHAILRCPTAAAAIRRHTAGSRNGA